MSDSRENIEHILLAYTKTEMVAYMDAHKDDVGVLFDMALGNKQTFSWRAAWLLFNCMEEGDSRLQKHVKEIIEVIEEKKEGHQRELLKILQKLHIDEDNEGQLFDICITIWEDIGKRPSVRFQALKIILKIAQKHPALINEISFLTQEHYLETLSPGIKRVCRQSLEKLLKKGA